MRNEDTVTVSAAEFHRNIGRYQDMALTKPVTITKNGRERTVLLSAEEYTRLKRRDRGHWLRANFRKIRRMPSAMPAFRIDTLISTPNSKTGNLEFPVTLARSGSAAHCRS